MANERNLTANDRTPSERRESARKAGIASGKARREKKRLKELVELAFERTTVNKKTGEEITTAEAIVLKQLEKALNGDTRAFTVLRDTAGQMPVQQVDVNATASTEAKFTELLEKFSGED